MLLVVGGALGAIARYELGRFFTTRSVASSLPLAMLFVNLIGSFGLGLLVSLRFQTMQVDSTDSFYLLLGTGFFGAFTTFSTFSMEAVQLFQKKRLKEGCLYIGLSLVGSVGLFIGGFYAGSWL
ncbi:fluoride efflux transporter CrcB [Halalkalibacterium ligniniphilum]|uniref:fluoride efflux transporter CrcB n=1 Tax=Halalkalibacterium ligniniphilum TaxID=1134413 RepID=UPI0009DA71D1|nr:fluoride efflux transporter CrcB [Halalkalibacterium ligniniphilum]